ncbi:MAG: hypothetical protein ACXVPD_11920, partial [Bacteroidia bacterium]
MKKTIFFLLFLPVLAAAQHWEWGKKANTSGPQTIVDICTDPQGNVILIGYNSSLANFRKTSTTLLGPGYFVAKFDSGGAYKWGKALKGQPSEIKADLSGNVWIAGTFTANFSTATASLVNKGSKDIFILKTDNNGNEIWAKSYGGRGTDYVSELAADHSGNVFFTGSFQDTIAFDSFTLKQLVAGVDRFYITKVNASGIAQWVNRGSLRSDFSVGNYLCLDRLDRPYVIGTQNGTYNPGGHFIVAYDAAGGIRVNYSPWSFMDSPSYVRVDNDFNMYTIINGHWGAMLWKFDTLMNYSYVTGTRGYFTPWSLMQGLELDSLGNFYLLGAIGNYYLPEDTITVGPDQFRLHGRADVMVTRLDKSGRMVWSRTIYGKFSEGDMQCFGLSRDGSLYVASNYNTFYWNETYPGSDTVIVGTDTLPSDGTWQQFFLAKFHTNTVQLPPLPLADQEPVPPVI